MLVLSELLGAPIQHLQFSLWYLKEKSFIKMDDSANMLITVLGVDFVESELLAPVQESKNQLYLPEPRPVHVAPPSSMQQRKP